MTDAAPDTYLVINAGSSSIKWGLYRADDLTPLEHKTIEVKGKDGYAPAVEEICKLIETRSVKGVGHRVVHGGRDYSEPKLIDAKVFADLEKLKPLAPLHQPHNLKAVKLIQEKHPELPQVACFDTAFHRTQPRINQIYALPRELTDEGIIRYGFHGLSYEYIAEVLPQYAGETAKGRVIVAHLGNGASLCAMKDGKSVATTMGFTPLDGLMMGTRTGAIDPGIPLYLQQEKGMSVKSVSDIFQKSSGLKGVSGETEDVRTLLASDKPEAKEAIDLFCLYAARQVASLTVDLGGLDALVFTAGIGENSDVIRQKICAHLEHLGVKTDDALNQAGGPAIGAKGSPVQVYVVKTDEELMMAQHVRELLQPKAPAPAMRPAPKFAP